MKNKSRLIATGLYAAWGLIHIAGGAAMLLSSGKGLAAVNEMMTGTALDAGTEPSLINGIVSFHSFNILVLGLIVLGVALMLNRKNSRTGYIVNLLAAGLADIGLILFLILPGYLSFADGAPGIVLFALAAVFSTIAIQRQPGN